MDRSLFIVGRTSAVVSGLPCCARPLERLPANNDVIAFAVRREQPHDGLCPQPLLLDHAVQHLLRVGKQGAGAVAYQRIVQYVGVLAVQFPGGEERRPVDGLANIGQVHIVQDGDAGSVWYGRRVIFPVQFQPVGAGIRQLRQRPLTGPAFATLADRSVLGGR